MNRFLKYLTILAAYITIFLFIAFIWPNKNTISIIESTESMENPKFTNDNEIINEYQKISKKIIPYIVKANVMVDNETYLAEIIEDKQNGQTYYVKYNDIMKWLPFYDVDIIQNNEEKLDSLSNFEIEFYINYNHYLSKTDYFIFVDIYRNETYILKRKNQYFYLEKRLSCSTGSLTTPTKRGLYTIKSKGSHFYSRDNTYICYNYLQYDGSYLLHSFPYSFNKEILDDRLGQRVSSGCVRFTFDDSKYLYDNIPIDTAILIN